MKKVICNSLIVIILIFGSCSTAPKKTGDVYKLRMFAEEGLKKANEDAMLGNYINAYNLLTEYKRMAVLADDPDLIARICLSFGNTLFAMGQTDEAFSEWDRASKEAIISNNSELLSVSRLFTAKGNLLCGRANAQSVLDAADRESPNIKKDVLFTAFSWQVKGLALRSLGRYSEAEDAFKRSLAIHEKELTLENASYDWYTIASIRSLAGKPSEAIEALQSAIALDRRIENSWGLAASYRAMGDVYAKAGRKQDALEAYGRAKGIYEALKNDDEAAEIDKKMRN